MFVVCILDDGKERVLHAENVTLTQDSTILGVGNTIKIVATTGVLEIVYVEDAERRVGEVPLETLRPVLRRKRKASDDKAH